MRIFTGGDQSPEFALDGIEPPTYATTHCSTTELQGNCPFSVCKGCAGQSISGIHLHVMSLTCFEYCLLCVANDNAIHFFAHGLLVSKLRFVQQRTPCVFPYKTTCQTLSDHIGAGTLSYFREYADTRTTAFSPCLSHLSA